MRRPFQGVLNIMRFNWPFYVSSFTFVIVLFAYSFIIQLPLNLPIRIASIVFVLPILVSLVVSCYVYDLSGLYTMNWLPKGDSGKKIININAGFDETSSLLRRLHPTADLAVFDFYDPLKHTEPSIKRARAAYPPFKGTINITTRKIPLENESIDTAYIIFAAHEIRDNEERIDFLREVRRALKPKGQVIIAEHLRDLPNFLAYTIGFFHFLPHSSWTTTFENAQLKLIKEDKFTPFISIFTLEKNGNSF